MADEQPRLQLLVFIPAICDHPFTWHPMRKRNAIKLIKKHLGRGNLVLFSNLFHHLREHPVVSKLKQDSCHEVRARLFMKCFVLTLFSFSFIESKSNVKFCHKNFPLPIVSHFYWTRNPKSVADEI